MPTNFDVPADAKLTLAMLRLPPNLNIELFEWSSAERRDTPPRHCDAGGHHLCFVVDDVDEAIAVLQETREYACSGSARKSPATARA